MKYDSQIAHERGKRLKEEIRRRGLTQGEVAESLDMSLSGLTYLLSGRSQINRTMAYALEFKLNIGSEWILYGSGSKEPEPENVSLDDQVETLTQIIRNLLLHFLQSKK
tara:strand:- start:63 stop:389 length:327 start_codon:yes stop_codon:yes gene_type:complete